MRIRSRYLRPLIHLVRVVTTVRLYLRFQFRPRRCRQTCGEPASIATSTSPFDVTSAAGTTIAVQATNKDKINSFFIIGLLILYLLNTNELNVFVYRISDFASNEYVFLTVRYCLT